MKQRLFNRSASVEDGQTEEVLIVPNAIERLVKGRQPLLSVQNKPRGVMTGEIRRSCERPGREPVIPVTHEQKAAGWVFAEDRYEQFLSCIRIPHEIALEIR